MKQIKAPFLTIPVIVDHDQYLQDQGRLKFTLAHEIGHWFLHEALFDQMRYGSGNFGVSPEMLQNRLYAERVVDKLLPDR